MSRHYLVVDLEATCDRKDWPRDESEIIEIGAVLVESVGLSVVKSFQTFVRPVVHPALTPFCTELTTIRQADVDGAPTFPQAMASMRAWLTVPALLCSWGRYDRNQLQRDAARHKVGLPLGKGHLDLKQAFAEQAGCRAQGLRGALRLVGLTFEGSAHRGIDDARNIARLLPWALGRRDFPVTSTPGPRRTSGGAAAT
jgi:inhibitor of KinA sporulation pathway (predicted exonuclease)